MTSSGLDEIPPHDQYPQRNDPSYALLTDPSKCCPVGNLEQLEHSQHIVEMLDDFCSNPTFTTAINQYMMENAPQFDKEILLQGGEWPLHYYSLFQQYTAMVEQLLERFLEQKGMTVEQIGESCMKMQEDGEALEFMCIEFIAAAVEFDSFLETVMNFKAMWEDEEESDIDIDYSSTEEMEEDDELVEPEKTEEDIDFNRFKLVD